MKFNFQENFNFFKKRKVILTIAFFALILVFLIWQAVIYFQDQKKQKVVLQSGGDRITNLLTELKKDTNISFYDIEEVSFNRSGQAGVKSSEIPELKGLGLKYAGNFEELKAKDKIIKNFFNDFGFRPDRLNTSSKDYPRISGYTKDDILCLFKEILNANATKEQLEIKCAYLVGKDNK